jgi:hypothetical protein
VLREKRKTLDDLLAELPEREREQKEIEIGRVLYG